MIDSRIQRIGGTKETLVSGRYLRLGLVLLAFLAMSGFNLRTGESETGVRHVIYNLDSTEFFVGTFGPITGETLDRFVDEHAWSGVTDLFINVNAQRTNYDSDVWEASWEELNPDAPVWPLADNMLLLHESGIDYPKHMLDRAQFSGMNGWISIRMNDAHLPDDPSHPLHSDFWRSHPEWHLDNTGLDYEVPEVRNHYLALIREISERYDMDGIELDFLRFRYYFRNERAEIGISLMTQLVQHVRDLTHAASIRLGHPVKLAVRVPTSPNVSRSLGLDAISWANAGLVDLVIASPFWSSVNTDIRVSEWLDALDGTGVELLASGEDGIDSGGVGRRTMTLAEMRGFYASMLFQGADAYFFNLFTNPYRLWTRSDYYRIIRETTSLEVLSAGERRHVVTIVDPSAEGEPRPREILPAVGTELEFDLNVGSSPEKGRKVSIELVVDNGTPTVLLNGTNVEFIGTTPTFHLESIGVPDDLRPPRLVYSVPNGTAKSGTNTIKVNSADPVSVRWVEIHVERR